MTDTSSNYMRREFTLAKPVARARAYVAAAGYYELRLNGQVSIAITLALGDAVTAEIMDDVRAVIDAHATPHSGAPPLELRWTDGNGMRARLRSRSLRLAATQAALTDLRALLGTERVRLVRGS